MWTILGPLKGVFHVKEPYLDLKQDHLGWWVVIRQPIREEAGWDELVVVESGPYSHKAAAEAELEKLR